MSKMDKLSGLVLKMKWSTQATTLLELWTLFLAVFRLVFDTCIKGTSSPVLDVPEQGLYVFLAIFLINNISILYLKKRVCICDF